MSNSAKCLNERMRVRIIELEEKLVVHNVKFGLMLK